MVVALIIIKYKAEERIEKTIMNFLHRVSPLVRKRIIFRKGGLTHVEVKPILWLRTKQIMARIKLFGYSLDARVSTALARLPREAPFQLPMLCLSSKIK